VDRVHEIIDTNAAELVTVGSFVLMKSRTKWQQCSILHT